MKMLVRGMALAGLSLVISGCGFWADSEEEIQPNPLPSFTEEKTVDVIWSADIGVGLGEKYHQFVPAISGDQVFATDNNGRIQAFSRLDGHSLWTTELNVRLSGGVGAGFGALAVASESGEVIALNGKDGKELWRAPVSTEVVSVPQLNRDLVVAQLINGKLVAFDRVTGERRWTYDSLIPRLTLRGTSTPIVTQDVTLAGFASGKIAAISNDNGRVLWERRVAVAQGRSELERMVDIDGRPLLVGNRLFVTSYQGRLVAMDPRKAQIIWSQNVSSYRGLAAGFGNVYVSEAGDAVQAFDQSSSASVWRQDALKNRAITSPAVLSNAVAVADAQGYIHFMSQVDGHFIARYQVDSKGVYGDMKVVDNVLYTLANSGRLVALQLK
ncbi:MAG: outer membrane protein assembly factor BamB [Pontibacterium sp.]